MHIFESFDTSISETCLYASHNAKKSKPRSIVCEGAHLENWKKTVNMKNYDFLASCTIKMTNPVINLMLKLENLGHIYILI